ncbi:hypothetical protein LCG56_27330 (plasmid) [Pseudomonas cannabina pv. alisalensis]|uniref:Uncharacterized protein n=1 Tax=Pseudomonas syringae pv. maculicola str. ES4326 TaxID=629265 RepID=A0A8T8CA95_PSEYM|nr:MULTISPECIES: hypothetical protein [Pseudomonas syringae group]QHF00500.1 hypothetical protein PMA4326_028710 [Pseudomonas syringae pv. maculicola str. ES4326]UBZ00478.1 hypothetical protein LCG56_27330 [Pseudomonas cannabina pv. alisalensis]
MTYKLQSGLGQQVDVTFAFQATFPLDGQTPDLKRFNRIQKGIRYVHGQPGSVEFPLNRISLYPPTLCKRS